MEAYNCYMTIYSYVFSKVAALASGSVGKESACNAGDLGKIPWRRKWQRTPVRLPGEFHGQRSWVGFNPWGHKELGTAERLSL